jgi:hypothetical protein
MHALAAGVAEEGIQFKHSKPQRKRGRKPRSEMLVCQTGHQQVGGLCSVPALDPELDGTGTAACRTSAPNSPRAASRPGLQRAHHASSSD